MDEWRVFFESLARNPGFWAVCLHVVQEARHYLERKLDKETEPAAPGGPAGDMAGFLDATGSWKTWVGRVVADTIRGLDQDTVGELDFSDVSARTAAVENAMGRLTDTSVVEGLIQKAIQSEDSGEEMESQEVKHAADLIVRRIASDDALCRRLMWNTVEEVRLLARGDVSDEDLQKTMESLRALVCERTFLDTYVGKSQAREQARTTFVSPPVTLGRERYEKFEVGQLASLLKDPWMTKLALKGPAGIGKTRLTRELTQTVAGNQDQPVVLYVPPWEYQRWEGLDGAIEWLVNSGLRAHGSLNEQKVVRLTLHRYRDEVVFILDGLDQARGSKGDVDALLTSHGALAMFRVLVAGRSEVFDRIGRAADAYEFPILGMERFSEDHVREFIRNSGLDGRPNYAQRALDDIKRGRRTYDTPLMLSLLCEVAEDAPADSSGPVSELGLLKEYIDRIEERERKQSPKEYEDHFGTGSGPGVQRIWERLAYEAFAWCSGGVPRPQVQHLERGFLDSLELKDGLIEEVGTEDKGKREVALRCALLGYVLEGTDGYRRSGQVPKGSLSFIHLVIQEYLAARALARRLSCEKFAPLRGIRNTTDAVLGTVRFTDLEELARPSITPNTARLLGMLVDDRSCPVDLGDAAWVDVLLEWILSEESTLLHELAEEAAGLDECAAAKRNNELKSNLLYTAVAVRDMRYGESLAQAQSDDAPEDGYEAHVLLDRLWAEQRAASKARQESFLEEHSERIAELRDNWPEALGPFGDWMLLPEGTSIIGSWVRNRERPIRRLRFPLPPDEGLLLLMCRHPVNNAEYERFRPDHDSSKRRDAPNGDARPIVHVSWEDAGEYCEWLSRQTGLTARLPRELEWEYACRAGTTTTCCFGNDDKELDDYAWQGANAWGAGEAGAHPVEGRKPNAWGLYDMHGNVWEWCQDWYAADYYENSPESDPPGPQSGASRVLRGGSWYSVPQFCRSAYRFCATPSGRNDHTGFRVLLSSRG